MKFKEHSVKNVLLHLTVFINILCINEILETKSQTWRTTKTESVVVLSYAACRIPNATEKHTQLPNCMHAPGSPLNTTKYVEPIPYLLSGQLYFKPEHSLKCKTL